MLTAIVIAIVAAVALPKEESLVPEEAAMESPQPTGPSFNADTAYVFCAKQCDFGPRTMNSDSHDRCAKWIEQKFNEYGMAVQLQRADLKGWDGTMLRSTNIIARHNPQAERRVLLCAHWDSRPWADNDPDEANHRKPVMAANDGASGVAVMLEVARLLSTDTTGMSIGIDFVCFDAEDWGTPQWAETDDDTDTWALGAQHFAGNMPLSPKPIYGILLDMVGGEGARFYQEGFSLKHASKIVRRFWKAARKAGYASIFPKEQGGYVTDDHVPLNERADIPTIDIIPYHPDCPQSSFGPTWHTVSDDMSHIDRSTLKAVGQSVVQMLWDEDSE